MKYCGLIFVILLSYGSYFADNSQMKSIAIQNFFPREGISFDWEFNMNVFKSGSLHKTEKGSQSLYINIPNDSIKVIEYFSDSTSIQRSYTNNTVTIATFTPNSTVGIIKKGNIGEVLPSILFPWVDRYGQFRLLINKDNLADYSVAVNSSGEIVLTSEMYEFTFFAKTHLLKSVNIYSPKLNGGKYLSLTYKMEDYYESNAWSFPLRIIMDYYSAENVLAQSCVFKIKQDSLVVDAVSPESAKIIFPLGSMVKDEINNRQIIVTETTGLGNKEDAIVNILDSLVDKAEVQKNEKAKSN